MIVCQSVYLVPYGVCIMLGQFLLGAVLFGLSVKNKRESTAISSKQLRKTHEQSIQHLEYLTLYRSSILYLTFVAILQVDFPALFPRRYCKTETQGYGLMDVGAASFCISAGFVRGKRKSSNNKNSLKPFLHTLPLIVIGIVRIVLNQELEYQEHVSEYGVHWNFFFTLGVLTLLPKPKKSLLVPIITMSAYQFALSSLQWQSFIEEAPRTLEELQTESKLLLLEILPMTLANFLVANREGILGCLGYLSLEWTGAWIGQRYLWNTNMNNAKNQRHGLGQLAVVLWMIHLTLVHVMGIPVSRRSTNLAFCTWALAHNVLLLYGLQQIVEMFNGTTSNPSLRIWETANKHGLIMFLIANLLTGLVNLTVPTLEMSAPPALLIMFGYICVVGIAAVLSDMLWNLTAKTRGTATASKKKE